MDEEEKRGRILQQDNPVELLLRPTSPFNHSLIRRPRWALIKPLHLHLYFN